MAEGVATRLWAPARAGSWRDGSGGAHDASGSRVASGADSAATSGSATGSPQTGLAKTHVSEVLTNPIYAGRLRTGEVAAIAPIVDPALWSTVQTMRERRRTRTPGRIVKGAYALRLCCAGCGKYLFGDVGRYRHPPPTCEGFLAAKPVVRCRRSRNRDQIDTRIKGNSYPQEWYEDAVGELLGKVGDLDDQAMTEVVRLYGEGLAKPDELTLARIEREREEASQRLAKTRDIAAWQATMAGSMRSNRSPASHGSTSAWRLTRSSRICARCRRSGPTQDPKDARHSPRRCSPSSKWRATRR